MNGFNVLENDDHDKLSIIRHLWLNAAQQYANNCHTVDMDKCRSADMNICRTVDMDWHFTHTHKHINEAYYIHKMWCVVR